MCWERAHRQHKQPGFKAVAGSVSKRTAVLGACQLTWGALSGLVICPTPPADFVTTHCLTTMVATPDQPQKPVCGIQPTPTRLTLCTVTDAKTRCQVPPTAHQPCSQETQHGRTTHCDSERPRCSTLPPSNAAAMHPCTAEHRVNWAQHPSICTPAATGLPTTRLTACCANRDRATMQLPTGSSTCTLAHLQPQQKQPKQVVGESSAAAHQAHSILSKQLCAVVVDE